MFAVLVSVIVLAISIALLDQVLANGLISYALGGWAAPWGIEYRIDEANAFVLLIVSAINVLAILYAHTSVAKEIESSRGYLFYTGWLLCLTGLLGITITGDAFNVFVFLEISSLSSYLLIALGKDRRALTAAFQYLVVGTIGATFILIGVGLLYVSTGTLNMADLAERIPQITDNRTVKTAFAFLTVGIGIKMALFPLHSWLPNAYAYAPSAVSVFLAATATKVAVYVLIRFFYSLFGAHFTFDVMTLQYILVPLAAAGIIVGSLIAVYENNCKRLLAYSSIAQIGYITLGIGIATVTGLTAAIIHLFNHAVIKAALFMALGCVFYRTGSVALNNMHGLAKRMPYTMAAFVVGGFSLIGVPLTVGFVSKWYLVLAAIEQGWWFIVAIVLTGSLIAIIYIWKVVEVAYFKPLAKENREIQEAPVSLLIPTWLLIAANIYFGVNASLTTEVAGRAAKTLIGVP